MNNYAIPRHTIAAAEMLEHESFNLKTGSVKSAVVAKRLRLLADMLEQKI